MMVLKSDSNDAGVLQRWFHRVLKAALEKYPATPNKLREESADPDLVAYREAIDTCIDYAHDWELPNREKTVKFSFDLAEDKKTMVLSSQTPVSLAPGSVLYYLYESNSHPGHFEPIINRRVIV